MQNDSRQTFIVYALVDPRVNEIRYIGRTGCPSKRLAKHRRGKAHGIVGDWERRLLEAGYKPEVRILEGDIALSDIEQCERFWIFHGLECGWPLLNLMAGSRGWLPSKVPEEVRRKIGESMRERWSDPGFHDGQVRKIKQALADPDIRAKLSELASEREMSDETRARIAQTVEGLWQDPKYRERQVQAHVESSRVQWQDEDFRETHQKAMNKPETKARISQKAKEMWADPEIRAKLVAERRSRGNLSDEHKAKIAAGVRRSWEERRQRKSKQNNGG